jgi:hypothetical protein
LREEFFEVKIGFGVGSSVSKLYKTTYFTISFYESNLLFNFYFFKLYFIEASLAIFNFETN